MEIVALLLAWAFALTFVAFTEKPKRKAPKAALVRVPARLPRKSVLRQMNHRQ
jgi:hypothetical protein